MSSSSAFVWDESFKAAADLHAYQFCGVKLTAQDTVDVAAATDRAIGVLLNKPAATGRSAEVRILGKAKVVVNANSPNIAVGDYVGPTTGGIMIKKSSADYNIIGIANQAASADGVIIEIFLLPINWFRSVGG